MTDKPAWSETPFLGVKCLGCEQIFPDGDACLDHECNHSASPYDGTTNVYGSTVYHEAETHTVHHDAVTHTEQIWVQDAGAYGQ